MVALKLLLNYKVHLNIRIPTYSGTVVLGKNNIVLISGEGYEGAMVKHG